MNEIILRLAERCNIPAETVAEWVTEQLIIIQDDRLDDDLIDHVLRIRRLTALGVNLEGVQIILHMRIQIIQHQSERDRIEAEMHQIRRDYEAEIARLMRQISL